jgi:hypothetical protein
MSRKGLRSTVRQYTAASFRLLSHLTQLAAACPLLQATVELKVNQQLQEALKHKLRGSAEEVRRMFASLDSDSCGYLTEKVGGRRLLPGTCSAAR